MYTGTSGSTQGDTNDRIPAPRAASRLTSNESKPNPLHRALRPYSSSISREITSFWICSVPS